MLVYMGDYKDYFYMYRVSNSVYKGDNKLLEILVTPIDFLKWLIHIKFNPFSIWGYPELIKFNYADFYEYRSRMGELIYLSLMHFKKMHETDKAWSVLRGKEKKGIDDAIWSFWFISECENEEGKTPSDVYGYDYVYSEEAHKKYLKGARWFANNFGTLWD